MPAMAAMPAIAGELEIDKRDGIETVDEDAVEEMVADGSES
jgi:hypothetical protein